MFIRQTKTRNTASGSAYTTFRLVASDRVGKQVRQHTLLNLGRQPDPELREIHTMLNLPSNPGGVKKQAI